ncbi:MAG: hypothetical protein Kow0090_05260 [Myxococcota bacterium]
MIVKIGTLSESLEDYLEIIYQLMEEKRVARVRDIAERKNVKMPSVIGALRRLADEGLINYTAREYVDFTDKGRELAHKVIRRHDFLTRFLIDILGVDPAVAEDDACTLEHALSPETVERMVAFYGFVTSCPEGGKSFLGKFVKCCINKNSDEMKDLCKHYSYCRVPDVLAEQAGKGAAVAVGGKRRRRGTAPPWLNFKTLDTLEVESKAKILRLRAPGAIRHRLVEMGILPGVEVELVRIAPLGGPIEIKVSGYRLSLRREEAAAIDVLPLD